MLAIDNTELFKEREDHYFFHPANELQISDKVVVGNDTQDSFEPKYYLEYHIVATWGRQVKLTD